MPQRRVNRKRRSHSEIEDQKPFKIRLTCAVCKWSSLHFIMRDEFTPLLRVPPECITCRGHVAVWWAF